MFTKTSTTSIVAVLLTVFGFILLGYLCFEYGDDATTRTQIITGVLSVIGSPAAYYFAASKRRDAPSGPAITQADNVNVNNPPADDQPQ